ncbi:MAG TPA: methylated-DNA--[protein]-cysteine S-methyltransferase [Terriglobales bacterium]|nr:methylated-DNA--[protein]-cysteine S-methyltransferase [Terriglobales bacterium]
MQHAAEYRSVCDSPVGPLTLVVSSRGVRTIQFGEVEVPEAQENPARTAPLRRQLDQYFAGKRRKFELELDWAGTTAFRQKVWRALLRVPYGKTASYGDIARAIRQPQAFRAVGQANRANPLPIVVPCHRVLGADGSLTGYSGTRRLDLKAQLLAIEHGAGSR